jgi:p-aminobenzoyl-glutamate transporter AbgT
MTIGSELPLAALPQTGTARALDWLERVGNRFPDPVVLFLVALALTWFASSLKLADSAP